MQTSENVGGIKINLETVDITIGEDIKEAINNSIAHLGQRYDKIEWADVYLEDKKEKKTQQKQFNFRLGIPGNDPFASEYGDNFQALLSDVVDKLQSQLEKR